MADAFNLLQMYQDDDDDDIMDDDAPKPEPPQPEPTTIETEPEQLQREEEESVGPDNRIEDLNLNETARINTTSSNSTPKWTNLRPPTPQTSAVESGRREKPLIVDYAHDDVAMSPVPEEGEISGSRAGRAMLDEDIGNTRDIQQRTPRVNVQNMTPNNHIDSPQISAQIAVSPADLVNHTVNDSEAEVQEGTDISNEDKRDVDPLDKFLPPPPKEKCSDELQEKINKFLAYKRQGKSFNVEVRNRKDYRNPDFLRHAVRYQDIDEIGSCFSKDVFDPHGYDDSDFYDALEADMKREKERKELERKKSPKVEFVSGGTQAGMVAAGQKVLLPSPGVSSLSSSGLQSGSGDTSAREGRQNKKSKWDKVDGDRRNPLGGQDNISAAALLSAAKAGAGYAMFAQQKRREAEEKRSSDKKAERRS